MAKLWGGRFTKSTHKLVEEFTKSIHFDQKLAKYDVLGSLCHIEVLKKAKLINSAEHSKLKKALTGILKSIDAGTLKVGQNFEDVHSFIQSLVDQKAGKAGLKLHTCRSRNDQVVVDMKLFSQAQLQATLELVGAFHKSLSQAANKNSKLVLPGFTHLQHAIPVRLSDFFTAYVQMLKRDERRLKEVLKNLEQETTIGAGALAGTVIPAAFYQVKAEGVQVRASENSIDSVSSRDFVVEILSALAIIGMHLSRLSEDMILWATKEFDFIDIDDAFCTGSSLMPQKKNPDVLELVRGYSGRLYGNLMNVLVMVKGLPLAYNRDMQLDKEPLFDSFEIVQKELAVLTELFKNIKFKKENIAKQLEDESLYATDLSDYLVQNKVPFKEAHTIIGKLIQHKYKSGTDIVAMGDGKLKEFHPLLNTKIVQKIIDPEYSVKSKKSVQRTKR